jgi:N-acetylglutamate synthase-like GNAT family acetyltransferase
MTDKIFKTITHGSDEYKEVLTLRDEVLWKPLGITFPPEALAKEKDHIQIAGFREGEVIAASVLVPENDKCKMQRVVVKTNLQASGIGSQMLEFCESYSKAQGYKSIYCHARDKAVAFYLKNNYTPEGDYFDEDGIPHLKMIKLLSGNELSLKAVLTKNEWFDYHRIKITERFRYFGEINYSSNDPVYSNPNHLHYVLYQKDNIIGALHIEKCTIDTVILRLIAIDGNYKNHGYGSVLLKQAEEMLKDQGYKKIFLHANPEALSFYQKNGYAEMEFPDTANHTAPSIDMGKLL